MLFLPGKSRDQLYLIFTSLNEAISSENEIRVIDAFVELPNLKA